MSISFTNLLNSVSDMGLVGCVGPQSFVAVQKNGRGQNFGACGRDGVMNYLL